MDRSVDAKRRLIDLVRATPGASTRELANRIGLSETTVAYHLMRLAKEDQVMSQVIGRARCWYASDCGLCPILRRSIVLLRRPGFIPVAAALSTIPSSVAELAERAGVGEGTARWCGAELGRAHLIERTQSGRMALREGADVCLRKAAAGEKCNLWGRCAMSRAWREARAGQAALATTEEFK